MAEKVILFGAGAVGVYAYHYFGKENIECFADNNPQKEGTLYLGVPIISFGHLSEKYANKEGFHIYLTSNLYNREIAEQLNAGQIENYSYFYDFLASNDQLEQLLRAYGLNTNSSIGIFGTSNATKQVLETLENLHLSKCIRFLFDHDDSKLIGRNFRGYTVYDKQYCMDHIDSIDAIIVSLPPDLFITANMEPEDTSLAEKNVIFANEAVKFISEEYRAAERILEEIDPRHLVSSNRLDMIVRYLLFKDMVGEVDNNAHKTLYAKTVLNRTGANERIGIYSYQTKEGVEEYLRSAEDLLKSLKEKGFDRSNSIPVSDKMICNGLHRVAASLALNENVFINKSDAHMYPKPLDFQWIEDNHYTVHEKIRILRAFADLYPHCGIFVVYAPVFEQIEYIKAQIRQKMNIAGTVELDFTNNYFAFENLINEIYSGYKDRPSIGRKIELLKFAPLKMQVILVSDEGHQEENLFAHMVHIKNKLRDLLTYDVDRGSFCLIHGTDRESEFQHLKNIILSVNNLKKLGMRINSKPEKELIRRLDEFRSFCMAKGFPPEDICIIGGSVLDVMGIRPSADIDFIMKEAHRLPYGRLTYRFTGSIELCKENHHIDKDGNLLKDAVLIDYDEYHFWFYGLKFLNLELVKYRKLRDKRDKDTKDLRLIQIFEDYAAFFDEKESLKIQIQKELQKREMQQK